MGFWLLLTLFAGTLALGEFLRPKPVKVYQKPVIPFKEIQEIGILNYINSEQPKKFSPKDYDIPYLEMVAEQTQLNYDKVCKIAGNYKDVRADILEIINQCVRRKAGITK